MKSPNKFFTVSPFTTDEELGQFLPPSGLKSKFAKQYEKEELRRKTIKPTQANKRRASQEDSPDRNIRAKSISSIPTKSSLI